MDMLEFSAREYIELSYQFGLILGTIGKRPADAEAWGEALGNLKQDFSTLGLIVTREHFGRMMIEIIKANPGKLTLEGGKVSIKDASFDTERLCHHMEAVYATMKAELGSVLLKVIPRERARYSNSEWIKDSVIQPAFPTSFKEMDRAGISYALGQSTASVFHSMRALEPALSALAAHFGISCAHDNWQNVIEQIESAVRSLGQLPKSPQKIADEKFFGGATSHLYFAKNAWRNHVAHARDSYSDDEARKILSHTLEFIESLCPRLHE
jgi:hypothetical protein